MVKIILFFLISTNLIALAPQNLNKKKLFDNRIIYIADEGKEAQFPLIKFGAKYARAFVNKINAYTNTPFKLIELENKIVILRPKNYKIGRLKQELVKQHGGEITDFEINVIYPIIKKLYKRIVRIDNIEQQKVIIKRKGKCFINQRETTIDCYFVEHSSVNYTAIFNSYKKSFLNDFVEFLEVNFDNEIWTWKFKLINNSVLW